MAMTKPKSSQITHGAGTVKSELDKVFGTSGTITAEAEWGDVPSRGDEGLDAQAQALTGRIAWVANSNGWHVALSGAIGDGTDETAKIQAADDYAFENNLDLVFDGSKTYLCSELFCDPGLLDLMVRSL